MQDPIAELYSVSAALHFLELSLGNQAEEEGSAYAEGAAYVSGLMSKRVDDIASLLATPDVTKSATITPRSKGTRDHHE